MWICDVVVQNAVPDVSGVTSSAKSGEILAAEAKTKQSLGTETFGIFFCDAT